MVEQAQVTGGRVQPPQATVGRRRFVLVELRIEMFLTTARPVAGKDDLIICAVDRADVVVMGWLIWHLGDDGCVVRRQAADFIKLPIKGLDLIALRRRTNHHAKEGLVAIPMHGWVAHGNRVFALEASAAITSGGGQVLERAIWVTNPEIATP